MEMGSHFHVRGASSMAERSSGVHWKGCWVGRVEIFFPVTNSIPIPRLAIHSSSTSFISLFCLQYRIAINCRAGYGSGNGFDFYLQFGPCKSLLGHRLSSLTHCYGFPQSLHTNIGIVPRLVRDHFLPSSDL